MSCANPSTRERRVPRAACAQPLPHSTVGKGDGASAATQAVFSSALAPPRKVCFICALQFLSVLGPRGGHGGRPLARGRKRPRAERYLIRIGFGEVFVLL
jgi:hypothetical protein